MTVGIARLAKQAALILRAKKPVPSEPLEPALSEANGATRESNLPQWEQRMKDEV